MNEREIESEVASVRAEAKVEAVKEPAGWIEDEVEEPERWDGLE